MYCPKCGAEVGETDAFCKKCGFRLAKPTKQETISLKNPGVAALIAALVGLFIMGMGHVYIGRIKRGVAIAIAGFVFDMAVFLPLFSPSLLVAVPALLIIILFDVIFWIWQIFDAYGLAKEYNSHVLATGHEPW